MSLKARLPVKMKLAGILEFSNSVCTAWVHIKSVEPASGDLSRLFSLQLEIDEDEWLIRIYDQPVDSNEQIGLP